MAWCLKFRKSEISLDTGLPELSLMVFLLHVGRLPLDICSMVSRNRILWEVAGVTYSDSDSASVPKFFYPCPDPVRQFFKFENPTPVQTPATIIDTTVIYTCFHLRNNHTDACYCRNLKVTPVARPFFHKFLTPGRIRKKNA